MPNDNERDQGQQKFQPKKEQMNKPGVESDIEEREQQGARDVDIDDEGMDRQSQGAGMGKTSGENLGNQGSRQVSNVDEDLDDEDLDVEDLDDEDLQADIEGEQVTGRHPSQRDRDLK